MSKDNIEKLDKQIELLKKDKEGKPTGEVEKVVTEILDPEDENHVINIDYGNSEVKESTKELKDLKTLTTEIDTKEEISQDTKKISLTDTKDAIVENEVEEIPAKVDEIVDNNNTVNKKSNKTLFIVLGVIIGVLVIVLIVCIFVFNGDDSKGKPIYNDNEETDNVLSKDKMIEMVDLYGKSLELEINNYYNVNNKLPDFSTVNNLVDLDHEVVCHIHEIYVDKTVYLDDCMVDYTDIDHSYGTKKEIVEEEVDNNNIKVYVNKRTKVATLEEPADTSNYYLYSSNVDSKISNISLLGDTPYLNYFDENTNTYELYNYITGKRAFHKLNYKSASYIVLYSDKLYNSDYSTEYIIINYPDSTSQVFSLVTGEPVGEIFTAIRQGEVAKDRVVVYKNDKYGLLNLKNGKLVLPVEYRKLENYGKSIVGIGDYGVQIFDEDGNRYLDNFVLKSSSVYDNYVFYKNSMYNINGKEICKFDTDLDETDYNIQRNHLSGDNKLIYHIVEIDKYFEKCYIYDIDKKECSIITKEECNKLS